MREFRQIPKETWPEWETFPDHGKLLFNTLEGSGLVVPDELKVCLDMLKYSARPTAYEIFNEIFLDLRRY